MKSRPWFTATGAGVWFLLGASACSSQELTYPPLPAGVVMTGSSSLGEADTSDVGLAEVTEGGKAAVWLARRIPGSGKEKIRWRVLDRLSLGTLGPHDHLILAVCAPRPDAEPDPTILGVVDLRTGDSTGVLPAQRAWRADVPAGRFRSIDAAPIRCLNEIPEGPD